MSDWIESEGKIRWIKSVFSPNKHMSGTYLFPQMANANIIIEIQNSWCLKTTHFENLIEQLKSNQKLKISEIMVSNAL